MIPIGLVLNELISNALKHAFSNTKHSKLELSLVEKDEILQLYIKEYQKAGKLYLCVRIASQPTLLTTC